MLPALAVLGVFTFYPLVFGIIISLYDYSVVGQAHFVGLENFARMFQDEYFWVAMGNSLKYLLVVPPIQVFSILLAILVNRKVRGIGVFRVSYYVPVVTSMVAVAIIWSWLFDPKGLINAVLIGLGLSERGVNWLLDPRWALWVVMFVTLWKGLGYYMMIYLAGLQVIPTELEEAAAIDGATRWQVLRKVTVPLLKPSIILCSIISAKEALRTFDEVFVMTNGGPVNSTLVMGLKIYDQAFNRFEFGYAAALGIALAVVIGVLTVINFKVLGRGGVDYY